MTFPLLWCCFLVPIIFLFRCHLLSAASSSCLDVAPSVSVAPPPPPPVVQLTPQIPLTGFVARMQESSKYNIILRHGDEFMRTPLLVTNVWLQPSVLQNHIRIYTYSLLSVFVNYQFFMMVQGWRCLSVTIVMYCLVSCPFCPLKDKNVTCWLILSHQHPAL